MNEKYNTKAFRKFAKKLKKDKLWNKFKILEYYFHIYVPNRVMDKNYHNSFVQLYDCLKHPELYCVKNDEYTIFPMDREIYLNEILDYYGI